MTQPARKTLTLLILTMFFLTMIYSVFLKELKGPFIEGDEIGYWTHAATMLGWDWKSALSETFPWYSYGYSLVLMPFLAISSDLEVAYRLAIILNIIFILGSYLISIAIVKKISRLNNIQTIMICFICSLYPAYIFQAQIAWSEIFLIFMIWLSFLMLLYYLENKKGSFCLICTCIVAYCFIIHNRALGILISYIVTMTILVWKKGFHQNI